MQTALNMLIDVKACMENLVDQGMSMENVLEENPLARFERWAWFHIDIERMTKVVYCLLTDGSVRSA